MRFFRVVENGPRSFRLAYGHRLAIGFSRDNMTPVTTQAALPHILQKIREGILEECDKHGHPVDPFRSMLITAPATAEDAVSDGTPAPKAKSHVVYKPSSAATATPPKPPSQEGRGRGPLCVSPPPDSPPKATGSAKLLTINHSELSALGLSD